jgi:SAM-dependent methyltransferase
MGEGRRRQQFESPFEALSRRLEAAIRTAPNDSLLYAQLAELNRLEYDLRRGRGASASEVAPFLQRSLGAIIEALRLRPDNGEYLAEFARCTRGSRLVQPIPQALRELIGRALEHPAVDPKDLANCIVGLAKSHPMAGRLPERSALDALLSEPLLCRLLELGTVADPFIERLVTQARNVALKQALDPEPPLSVRALSALAQQCFITEYVYDTSGCDSRELEALERAIEVGPVPPHGYAVYACHRPLASLHAATRISAELAGTSLAVLARAQIDEPLAERQLKREIPRLTAMATATSETVQSLYESNPYPRWIRAFEQTRAGSLRTVLHDAFPGFDADGIPDAAADILVAGCGTTQAIETARRFPGSSILAVDLSLSSLAYASRKARELNLAGIEFAQADLLGLGVLERRFDLVECTGVLHHLEHPLAGWRFLRALLRPRGLMRIALYSQAARAGFIDDAKALIAAERLPDTPEGIRRCRAAVHAGAAQVPGLAALTQNSDFYSMSGCRDLLFHPMEHRFDLPAIGRILDDLALELVGFEVDWATREAYNARFGDDPRGINLQHWHAFEGERPDTFSRMYRFWARATT